MKVSKEHQVPLKEAAFILALQRLVEKQRGWFFSQKVL
jgi:hypothetical protein